MSNLATSASEYSHLTGPINILQWEYLSMDYVNPLAIYIFKYLRDNTEIPKKQAATPRAVMTTI